MDGNGGGPVVAYGRDGDRVLIDDRSVRAAARSPAERLADARARVGSYKHRLIEIDPALVEIDARPAAGRGRGGPARCRSST